MCQVEIKCRAAGNGCPSVWALERSRLPNAREGTICGMVNGYRGHGAQSRSQISQYMAGPGGKTMGE